MRVLQKTISLAVLISFASQAFANWTWVSDNMLVTQGISQYADRLEIIRADDCDGLRRRAWAKIGDKAGNTLKRGDMAELDVRLGDVQVLHQTRVLNVAYDFDADFDVIYLDFGDWRWGVVDLFSANSDQSLTAIFFSDKATIDDNVWGLDGFEQAVVGLRENCKPQHTGVRA